MSTDQDQAPGVVGVATSGIQDVSALLPLLGTEQCERLITSALQRGLLYAAATPMSVFGSLGIVKAGFVVLWTSIDSRLFPGPTLMQNAGFTPSGIGELLVHVAGSNRHLYVAEDKLRSILAKKRIRSVKINLLSKDLLLWNFRLIAWTTFLSAFGLTPYIYLIVRFLPDKPFWTTWLYPILRIAGCDLVAISIQFIYQLRILEETYCRIRFLATDNCFKDHGKSLPAFWDSNERSKDVLSQLRIWLRTDSAVVTSTDPPADPEGPEEETPPEVSLSLDDNTKQLFLEGLGRMTSFSFPSFGTKESPAEIVMPIAEPVSEQATPVHPDPSEVEKGHSIEQGEGNAVPRLPRRSWTFNPELYFTTLLLWIIQAELLFGLGLAIVGYIGCFSVVQAAPRSNSKGPLVWLALEAVLAIARTLLWAWNPTWDDAKSPIALEKVAHEVGADALQVTSKKCSYGIGWMLNSVTADDMHALIVGINVYNTRDLPDLSECVGDAHRVAAYLEDTLLVPRSQIVALYDSDATKDRIIEALKSLAHRGSVTQDAPIVIYFATHSFVAGSNKKTFLVPHHVGKEEPRSEWENTCLSYDEVVDLLQHVAEEKTDNITLILDSCHAGAMGRNEKFTATAAGRNTSSRAHDPLSPSTSARGVINGDENHDSLWQGNTPFASRKAMMVKERISKKTTEIMVGHSSHILLAGTGVDTEAFEQKGKGGVFTQSLLAALQEPGALETMTYKKLVDEINKRMKSQSRRQEALCTTIYQNRLLFNGLFSRKLNEDSSMPVITVEYSDT
ncbi:caspase domain-containing protein [Ephemerocybe angulata]|uniref:Caspase domain-containing protein n=1 Tax=Ephemerocybe angulata TaxID=980116 RepID=A0A8H6MG83_9AGAR|nr:caspase domain-containing protein [Tulosesus angulatus]